MVYSRPSKRLVRKTKKERKMMVRNTYTNSRKWQSTLYDYSI